MYQILEEKILKNVLKPGRYTGGELNSIKKDWNETEIKVALSYPDIYEVGMSNLGLQILYSIINNLDFALAERSYAPWPDMEEQLRKNKLPLYSLESYKPLKDFDMIGFSLQHELTYTNLLNILDLSGIPIHSKDRLSISSHTSHLTPLIFAGGPCTFNPEPISDFIDFFLIGEGEEAIVDIINVYRKNKSMEKGIILKELSKIEGIYVPAISKENIKKRIVKNLDKAPYPTKPIVPFIQTIHDRAMLEIMRGCPRQCKFCHACATYKPVRIRKPDTLVKQAEEIIKNTGHEDLSLVSLSTSDYPKLGDLANKISKKLESKKVSISLPSVRMDSFSIRIAKDISHVRPSSVTLAPEAGSQRLRDIIAKDLSEEQILSGAKAAFEAGIEKIKLYFMIGLPTETEEDLKEIISLVRKISDIGKETFRKNNKSIKRLRITASVSTFIPKPHTPFEKEEQISIEETLGKQIYLKENLRERSIELRWHDANISFLEGVFSRGDRNLSKVIESAWKKGAKLDAWSEYFNPEIWQKAFTENNINSDIYLEKRTKDNLPWSFIKL